MSADVYEAAREALRAAVEPLKAAGLFTAATSVVGNLLEQLDRQEERWPDVEAMRSHMAEKQAEAADRVRRDKARRLGERV